MATKEEQEWAGRLEEAFDEGFEVGSGLRAGYLAEARLVLADRAALVERAEKAEKAEANIETLAHAALTRAGTPSHLFIHERIDQLTADRDRLAAELEAVRGSGGVLTREECAAMVVAEQRTRVHPSVTDATAGARAQRARDVAAVRAKCKDLEAERDFARDDVRHLTKERDAARAEVERLKGLLATWSAVARESGATSHPTPPADLDGWLGIYDRAANAENDAREKAGLECHREEDEMAGVAAVIAARDAWWEERLVALLAKLRDMFNIQNGTDPYSRGRAGGIEDARRAAVDAISAVKATAAPAPAMKDHPLPDMRGATLGSTVGLLPGDVVTVIDADGSERNHVYRPEDEPSAAPAPVERLTPEDVAERINAFSGQALSGDHVRAVVGAAPAPAQPAGRSSSLADLGITTLEGAAFAYDTMRSQWVEVVDRLYAVCAVVGVEASVLPGAAIVEAVKEAVADLSTALGAPPGESWDALLGRVRGVVRDLEAKRAELNDLHAKLSVQPPTKPPCPHLRCEAGSSRCLDCGARPPRGQWPPTDAELRASKEPAPPPLPEVPACPVSDDDLARWRECGPYSKSPMTTQDVARTLAWLVDAIRARGGL